MGNKIFRGFLTQDGAGVKLTRIFANETIKITDPFLLLDHFGSDNPAEYIKGFPWHPHRGIETITYMLDGEVEHEDSLGNKGIIRSGDVQWMSAGSGMIHQEMPKGKGLMQGLQLWVNMPKKNKMNPPKYRDITKDKIPIIKEKDVVVKIISGNYKNKTGPAKDLVIPITYLDINMAVGEFEYEIKKEHILFVYVYEGEGLIQLKKLKKGDLMLIQKGDLLKVRTKTKIKFILVSGKPLQEPIVWGGPIVMNTEEELELAYKELRTGTFIKHNKNN